MDNKFRYILIGVNYYNDIQNDLFKFNTFNDFKFILGNMSNEKLEYYTSYIVLDFNDNSRFEVLKISNEQLGNINVKSKLKRVVRGYFQFNKIDKGDW